MLDIIFVCITTSKIIKNMKFLTYSQVEYSNDFIVFSGVGILNVD